MSLATRIEEMIAGLSEDDTNYLKKSLRLKTEDDLPSIETLEDICTPTFIGPTWLSDSNGWVLPEKTS